MMRYAPLVPTLTIAAVLWLGSGFAAASELPAAGARGGTSVEAPYAPELSTLSSFTSFVGQKVDLAGTAIGLVGLVGVLWWASLVATAPRRSEQQRTDAPVRAVRRGPPFPPGTRASPATNVALVVGAAAVLLLGSIALRRALKARRPAGP